MKKLLMVLALLPLMATAETETVGGLTWSYEVQDDCAVITGVSPEPCGALTLPGKLGGRPISLQNESSWRELMAQVTSLTIPDTIVTIPDGAFQVYEDGYFDEQIWEWVVTGSSGWVSLAEVDIPMSVTKIGRWSFENTPLMKNGGKPHVPVYSKDGRWLLGFSRMYEDYEWATYQEYVEARSVRIPATVQFAVDGSLGEICSEVPGYFLEGSRVTFLGARPAGLTEAAFNSTTDEIEEGPKAVYYLEGAAGWTHGETWCGIKTYSSGELSPEQKTKSELSLGLVYEGGYRYGDYVAIGFKMTDKSGNVKVSGKIDGVKLTASTPLRFSGNEWFSVSADSIAYDKKSGMDYEFILGWDTIDPHTGVVSVTPDPNADPLEAGPDMHGFELWVEPFE